MIVRQKDDLAGTGRAIATPDWSTTRLLLREDGFGLTVTDVRLPAGMDVRLRYKHHLEVCYCLGGRGSLEDLATGRIHPIRPGTLWALAKGEAVRFRSDAEVRLVSIFEPALEGPETWVPDEDGAQGFPPPG